MFLKNIYDELKNHQIAYKWKITIDNLSKIDISEKEWRMIFIIEVLKMGRSMWIQYFTPVSWITDLKLVKQLITQCKTYYGNTTIVKAKILQIIWMFENELLQDQINDFDFTMINDIIMWRKKVKDFIETSLHENKNNIFSFVWKSWTKYNGRGIIELNTLKTEDVMDIIEWYKTNNETIQKALDYLINTDKKEINKEFKSQKAAWLSLINDLIKYETGEFDKNPETKKWKMLTFIIEKK